MVVNSIKDNQLSFLCFSTNISMQHEQTPHFLELGASCFNFFLGALWSPLLSHNNYNSGFIKLDISITVVNPALFDCRCTQLSMSSLTFCVSSVEKKWVVSTSLTPNWEIPELKCEASTRTEVSSYLDLHNWNFNLRRFQVAGRNNKSRFWFFILLGWWVFFFGYNFLWRWCWRRWIKKEKY